ncbi:MAG: diguanylate cyclase, partial [Candidatus Omnitrophota bacterium]
MSGEYNILIIENDAAEALILESTLKSLGYNTWVASRPQEALELMRSNYFAVVIAPLRSTEMNGVDLTLAVHKISPKTNVVVLTAYAFISSAIEALEAGAYGYINKPLNKAEIRIVVSRAVENSLTLKDADDKDYLVGLAVRDGLTGVFNRRYFNELIVKEANNQKHLPTGLSILMLDIDNFKKYNDTQGHQAGDLLLKDAAKVFNNSARSSDLVCRYGGEEFVVVM